jgi:acetyl esterase/lipase
MKRFLSALTTLFLLGSANSAEPQPLVKTTHTYKTVGDLKIQADAYRPDDTKVRPVVVWIHGGALITGSKSGVPKNLLDLCLAEDYTLVSIDYRLAPEVKLPEIIADVEDAFTWLRKDGPKTLHIDPKRMVITGGSAGGYLTLTMGARLKEKPKALVAYWGYGDVDGEWYTKPSEHYRKAVPLVEKDDAYKAVSKTPLTGSEPNFDGKARSRLYLYFRQNGLWTKEVTGFDPVKDKAKLDPYCPVRNVTKDYPPTMLVHGTEDTDVPYELSANMAKEFEKHKVPFEFVTVKGAGHGLSGGDKKLVADAHDKAFAFIREKLKAKE